VNFLVNLDHELIVVDSLLSLNRKAVVKQVHEKSFARSSSPVDIYRFCLAKRVRFNDFFNFFLGGLNLSKKALEKRLLRMERGIMRGFFKSL